jgi:RimJ/RimL family protein N-acetyltransferase
MYEGRRVKLREMRVEDAETYVRWLNQPDMAERIMGGAMPLTLEQEKDWISKNAGRQDDSCHFAVETIEGKLIGVCSYHKLDWKNRKCEVGWFIGDPENRGQGYGADLIETLLNICFNVLGLRKVSLLVFEFNEAVRLYERLGFKLEGVLRKEKFVRGKWWDERRYGLFKTEWAAQRGISLEPDEV